MYRSSSWAVSALLILASITPCARADDKDPATVELESRIDKGLVQAINAGAQLFNLGDQVGCYKLYQGTLISLTPVLADRPDLQDMATKALAAAEANGGYGQKAQALRATLDDLRFKLKAKPLWGRLGGEPAVKSVVHEFVLKAASNPKVNFLRDGKYKLDDAGVAHLEELLVQLISQVTGGPLKYTGRDMKSTHAGMAITAEEFNASAADLIEVLKSKNVPDKEIGELVAIIGSTKRDIVQGVKPPDMATLWMRLGGEPAVKSVVHDFVAKAATDPKVNFTRNGKYSLDEAGVAHLEELLVQQISSVTGGPLKYTGRAMKPVHEGMKITEQQFGAMAIDLIAVLKIYKVPEKEIKELIEIIASTSKDIVEGP